MRVNRFYLPDTEFQQELWIHDRDLIHQFIKVLRFKVGNNLVLFDGQGTDIMYVVQKIEHPHSILLHKVTNIHTEKSSRSVALAWSLLKKDKNEWVAQKATELGVDHLIPIISERSEKLGLNYDRIQKIVIEAAEQSGRSYLPKVREPINLQTLVEQYSSEYRLFYCHKLEQSQPLVELEYPLLITVGPEGGWSDQECQFFENNDFNCLQLSDNILRAETACITAVGQVLSIYHK